MNANVATAAPAAAPALLRRAGPLDTMVALVRRELWEHRALWIAPLAVEALLALALLFGRMDMDLPDGTLTSQLRVSILTIAIWGAAQPVFLVTSIVLSFYLLDCLFSERKDRSILFWKSLPLSDGLTVSSKFLVAAVVVPLGVFVLASVSDLLFLAIAALRAPGTLSWSTYEWLRTELTLLLEVALAVLWYAPLAAALLLFSAWIRRAPIVWATLVPVVAPIVERVALGTHYIYDFERYRINGIWHKLLAGPDLFADAHHLPTVGAVLGRLNLGAAFGDADLWMGVAAALAMIYAAARIRRYRDDT
jgi:ABC-2 type transport system permease protein